MIAWEHLGDGIMSIILIKMGQDMGNITLGLGS